MIRQHHIYKIKGVEEKGSRQRAEFFQIFLVRALTGMNQNQDP